MPCFRFLEWATARYPRLTLTKIGEVVVECISKVESSPFTILLLKVTYLYLMVIIHLRVRASSLRNDSSVFRANNSACVIFSIKVYEVLEAGGEEAQSRVVEVVEVPMTGRAERNCIIDVPEVIERNQALLDELRNLNQKYKLEKCEVAELVEMHPPHDPSLQSHDKYLLDVPHNANKFQNR